jgi:L-amino acid N-acyltransferase YncA
VNIRVAHPHDAAACAAVYERYVLDTAISFEEDPPGEQEMRARMRAAHLWLVAEHEGAIVGFAYGARHQARAAYRWAAEVSVYLDAAHHRRGIGRALYRALIDALGDAGLCTLVAGVTQPNGASNALHESLGFTRVGTYTRIGFKHGCWHDVLWLKLDLMNGRDSAPQPLRRPVLRGAGGNRSGAD